MSDSFSPWDMCVDGWDVAPGEEGVERVWRLTRAVHEGPPSHRL